MMKTKIMRSFALLILSIVCMLTCFGCADANETFELVGEPTFSCVYNEEEQAYDVVVEGIAKNNGDEKWEWLDVTFMLYDAENNVLGSAYASIEFVAAQGTWRFCATAQTSYEVASVALYEFDGYTY